MLLELISRIALSETFKYGSIGQSYVGSNLHIYLIGEVLIEKYGLSTRPKAIVKIRGYHIEQFEVKVGMYDVILYHGDGTLEETIIPKSYLETLFEIFKGKFVEK